MYCFAGRLKFERRRPAVCIVKQEDRSSTVVVQLYVFFCRKIEVRTSSSSCMYCYAGRSKFDRRRPAVCIVLQEDRSSNVVVQLYVFFYRKIEVRTSSSSCMTSEEEDQESKKFRKLSVEM